MVQGAFPDHQHLAWFRILHLSSFLIPLNVIFFQIEGEVEKDSEVRATYKDLHAKRPICQKLTDHTEEIQPRREMEETSEYRDTLNKIEVRDTIKHHTHFYLTKSSYFSEHEN